MYGFKILCEISRVPVPPNPLDRPVLGRNLTRGRGGLSPLRRASDVTQPGAVPPIARLPAVDRPGAPLPAVQGDEKKKSQKKTKQKKGKSAKQKVGASSSEDNVSDRKGERTSFRGNPRRKCFPRSRLQDGSHFDQALMC